jgi:methionyl aminopeptidase
MNSTYKKNFIQAGALAGEVREFGKSLIQPGASYQNVLLQINQKIRDLGAKPAFPPQMALNEVAAHYLAAPDEDILFSDQIIKLDVGVCYQGAIGDCAVTVDLSGRHQKLIDAAEEALLSAEKILKVGLPIRQIGKIIEDVILSYGLQPIRNLSGHGLGPNQIHTLPTIPNYYDQSKGIIKPGMTFAIEPFATNGEGLIYEKGRAMIFSQISKRTPATEAGRQLIEQIKRFEGLPFSLGEIHLPAHQMQAALKDLLHRGTIAGYPPLVEQRGGMVAQAENSVLVDEKGTVHITTRLKK